MCTNLSEIKQNILNYSDKIEWYKKNKHQALWLIEYMIQTIPTIPLNRRGKISYKQAMWHLFNGNDVPTCKMCSNHVKWNDDHDAYQTYCSSKCSVGDLCVREKKKATTIERYGVENYFYLSDKVKQSMIKKHKVDHPSKSKVIREKKKATNIERYGVDHPWKNKSVRKKCVESHDYRRLTDEQYQKLLSFDYMKLQLETNHLSYHQLGEIIGVFEGTVKIYAKQHGIVNTQRSKVQNQLVDFIKKEYVGEIKVNSKTIIPPYEIDIVIPEFNFAIELDGVFWHGELNGKDRRYHISKTKKMEECGYDLMHIYDYEWTTKCDIVCSRILNKLGKSNKIYARKTEIRVVDKESEKVFFNNNHIQQYSPSSVCIGLFFDNELVACMSFVKPRFNKHYQWELLRYASKLNTNVVGGGSKLFSFFIKQHNPLSVISYSDNRWGTGGLYRMLGFEFLHNSSPNYKYFVRNNSEVLYNRVKFQKHKLVDMVGYDKDLSEWDIMILNGYDRIWDCGNGVWSWKRINK